MKTKPYLLFFFCILAFLMGSCTKIESSEDIPNCIKREIRHRLNSKYQPKPDFVERWTFKGQNYYYFPFTGCCDMASQLYDSDCNLICSPDGGFTGGGDGRCPNFSQDTLIKVVVWRKER